MAADFTQQSQPLHVENTVMMLGKKDLDINNAFHTYRDMKMDAIVSGSMSFLKALISKSDLDIVPHKDATTAEKALTEALNESLHNLEGWDVKRLVSNWLSSLDYGCSLSEVVLKRDENGRVVFKTISPIHLTTVERFQFDGGTLDKLLLNPAENDGLVSNIATEQKEIDGSKILMFRLEPDQDFPLGKSLLYGAYTSWKAKKILQEYEAIGVAKNLSGVLNVKIPSDYINKYFSEPNSDEAIYVDNLVRQAEMLHAGKGSYILTASDTQENGVRLFEVDTIGGSGGNAGGDVGTTINRYNNEILLSLQTVVLAMGSEGGGSFALSDNTTHLMTLFIENIRKVIESEFRKALKMAFSANGLSTARLPSLKWDEIEPLDWDDFTKGWQRLLTSGGVTSTEELEAFFRERGKAPKANYDKVLYNDSYVDESERADPAKEA